MVPAVQPGDRRPRPTVMRVVGGQGEGVVSARRHQQADTARDFPSRKGTAGGAQHEFLLVAHGERIGNEAEAFDVADVVALDDHFATDE